MLMILSMAFLTGAPAIFLLAFLNILLYQILAPLEERKLLDQYGPQYEDYRRSVPRFVASSRADARSPDFVLNGRFSCIQRFCAFLLVAMGMVTLPLWAQQPCPSFTVAVGTDEDQLMLAINGADNPQGTTRGPRQVCAGARGLQVHALRERILLPPST